MNAYQKATILVSLVMLPLMLLFMNAMNYRGVELMGVAWLAGGTALLYALRKASDSAPLQVDHAEDDDVAPGLQASLSHRGFESRGLR